MLRFSISRTIGFEDHADLLLTDRTLLRIEPKPTLQATHYVSAWHEYTVDLTVEANHSHLTVKANHSDLSDDTILTSVTLDINLIISIMI